jgi:ubiquitin C-terminal hydrolase
VDRCKEIVANVRMEERYAGMSLVFVGTDALREEIENAIEKVTKQTKMDPHIFDNSKDHHESKQALYIEFNDDVQRDSGEFFELLLRELHIDKCANDVI